MKTIITKGEFATLKQRSPACVTKWIKAGKISPDALIGNGNSAKIWVERADADLAASLDPSQQAIQAAPVQSSVVIAPMLLERPDDPPPRLAPSESIARPFISDRELDLARRAKADADKAEHDAEAARRKLAIDEGRYVLAEEAASVWGRELTKLIGEIEMFVSTTLSRDLAEHHDLDWKMLSAEMRESFRKFRAASSDAARTRREELGPESA